VVSVFYCDSSALLKRTLSEPESIRFVDAMDLWLDLGHVFVTSVLTVAECERALRARRARSGSQLVDVVAIDEAMTEALSGVAILDITRPIIHLAGKLGPQQLRTLDAIHLATAHHHQVQAMVTYGDRLALSSEFIGIPALRP